MIVCHMEYLPLEMKEQLNERESAIMKSFAESSDKLSADYEKKIELLRQKQDAKIIELKREKSELVENSDMDWTAIDGGGGRR